MPHAFWTARTVLGAAGILFIAALIGTYPHPDYRPGMVSALLVIGLLPSLMTIVALLRGGAWPHKVIPRLAWLAPAWAVIALPIALFLGMNVNTFLVVPALPLQLVVLPLLAATRNPSRIALLQRIVRIGLVVMLVAWAIASAAFAALVRHAADTLSNGAPYCLSEPTPGSMLRSTILPSHLDFLILQRIISYPTRYELTRYRLQVNIPGAEVEQWHLSFLAPGFVPGGDIFAPLDCGEALRKPATGVTP